MKAYQHAESDNIQSEASRRGRDGEGEAVPKAQKTLTVGGRLKMKTNK